MSSNVRWDPEARVWRGFTGKELFEGEDLPPAQEHYPFDGQMRDVFGCLRFGIEEGTPQDRAYRQVFKLYGEFHQRMLECEDRLAENAKSRP